jgi:hypothetical protein
VVSGKQTLEGGILQRRMRENSGNYEKRWSEDRAQLESENGGVLYESGTIRPDNVLEQRLGIEPLVQLDAIIKLHNRFVSLDGPSPALVGKLLVIAVVAVCESNSSWSWSRRGMSPL